MVTELHSRLGRDLEKNDMHHREALLYQVDLLCSDFVSAPEQSLWGNIDSIDI
jgi:hypothetical protein